MALESLSPGATWTNWVGNQSFSPALAAAPVDEVEVVRLVRDAAARGATLRVAGAGHSVTPLVETDGVLLDLSALAGVITVDRDNATVTALPATTIGMFGEPLWDLGLALENQGDIDTQQIAGAVATGTHGSGVGLRSFSGLVRSMRLVTGAGDVLDVDGSQPDLLHAAQVAVGMLGVITRLELQVVPAYRLAERIDQLPYAEVMEGWDELVAAHRHFSFFWLPSEESAAMYGLTTSEGERAADSCYVKVYDEAAPDCQSPPRGPQLLPPVEREGGEGPGRMKRSRPLLVQLPV
jgi:FAD/FMN-containing dehydrogenase